MAQTDQATPNSGAVTYTADADESLADAVLRALYESASDATGTTTVDVVETLDPLYETVDLEALDRLFRPGVDGETTEGTVTFVHAGYDITVSAAGDVTVRPTT
ncbi:HalOD1 output domain-containing protein [Halobacteriales archaeon Cl-PHB]